jgi:DNA primase
MISKDTISLVRDRTDLVSVVSESVPSLKKRGRRFVGLCPFHKEKTPSFHVNPDTGLYHCFGCKESGDAIAFLERIEGYSFIEAVRALAERAGIAIEEQSSLPSDVDRHKKDREALYAVMQMAAGWYETQLREHPERSYAVEELARRGLEPNADVVQAFRVGYAPPAWDGLASFLKKQGVSPAQAESVGLIVPRSSATGYYDRFRQRLMFAVIDSQGRVVAFSGRALAPASKESGPSDPPPKYINSPESPIYVKGANLFGLWQARHAVRQEEHAILVEGNFDVVSLHAQGVSNVVAPLGTAFTTDQAKLLRRYASKVTLLFDGDTAGRKATCAAEQPCDEAGLDATVAQLPHGLDPDEFVRSKGTAALRHLVAYPQGLPNYLIDVDLDPSFNAADPAEKVARIHRIAALIARQTDPIFRGMLKAYADYAASRLDLVRSPDAFHALQRMVAIAGKAARVPTGPRPWEARIKAKPPGQEERKAIVGAILDFPVLLDDPEVIGVLELLQGESARIVATIAKCRRVSFATQKEEKVLDSTEFLAQMPPAIQAFAHARLAAPAHEDLQEARTTVMANAKKLREANIALETRVTVREQERDAGDWDAGVERAKHVDALVRERQGIRR